MFLSLTAYILIPVYTVLFVHGSNWFTTNFSVIGNSLDRKSAFVLWGLMVGIYFFQCLHVILNHMPVKPVGSCLVPLSIVLLTFALTTPYLPKELPFQSFLHIIFAFMAAVCLLLCLYLTLWRLYQEHPLAYRPYFIALFGITVISIILLIMVGIISSALEIFFTISTTVLTRRLAARVMENA